MRSLRTTAAAVAVAAAMFAVAPAAAQGPAPLWSATYLHWMDMNQAACADRAGAAFDAAAARFGLPAGALQQTPDDFFTGMDLEFLAARIFCIADGGDGPVNAAATRVLVLIDVDATAAELVAPLRDFLQACFFDGACEAP